MARIATTIEDILSNVRDNMLANGVVDSSSVFLCDSPEEVEANQGVLNSEVLAVWWRDLTQQPADYFSDVDADEIEFVTSTLGITVWSKQHVDELGRSDAAVTDQDFGSSSLVRAVIAALNDQEVINDDGDYLLLESLTFRGITNNGKRNRLFRRYDVSFDLKFRWNIEMPSQFGVLVGNIVYVDAVNGVDATGARGYRSKPFLTPVEAQAAASSGDTIVVLPGSYALTDVLGKSGVNWFLMPGVAITGASTLSVFSAPTAMTFSVIANGATLTAGESAENGTIYSGHSSTSITVDNAEIVSGSLGPCIYNSAGTIIIRNSRMSNSADSNTVTHNGTLTKLEWCEVRNTSSAGVTVSTSGFIMQGGIIVSASNSFYAASAQTVKIYGQVMASFAKHANVTVGAGGTLTVDGTVT